MLDHGIRLGALVAAMALLGAPLSAQAGHAPQDDTTHHEISEALEEAEPGDTILVKTDGATPIHDAPTVDVPRVTICPGGSPEDGAAPEVLVVESDDECELLSQPGASGPVIDSTGEGTNHVLQITAEDVTVRGLELRSTLQLRPEVVAANPGGLPSTGSANPDDIAQETQRGMAAVVVHAPGISLQDNVISVKEGPCVSLCPSPTPGTGVYLTPEATDAEVIGTDIEVTSNPSEGTVDADHGIVVASPSYTIGPSDSLLDNQAENRIFGWSKAGILVQGIVGEETTPEDATQLIQNNQILHNDGHGIQVDDVPGHLAPTIRSNTLTGNGLAGVTLHEGVGTVVEDNTFTRSSDHSSTGLWIRGADDVFVHSNDFEPSVTPLNALTDIEASQVGSAITVSASNGQDAPEGLELRDNYFEFDETASNQYALRVTPDVQDTYVDARANDWDVYTWEQVVSRTLDLGTTNDVEVVPFQTG